MTNLTTFTTSKVPTTENLELQSRRNADFGDEQLGAMPVVLCLVLDLLPYPFTQRFFGV
jgi:hypothetical protein